MMTTKKHKSHNIIYERTLEDEEEHLESLKEQLRDLNLLKSDRKIYTSKMNFKILLNNIIKSKKIEDVYTAIGKYIYIKKPTAFKQLEHSLISSDYDVVIERYLGQSFLISLLSFILSSIFFVMAITIGLPGFGIYSILYPFVIFIFVFFIMYSIPMEKANSKKRSIKTNLPFALTHLSAISSSGTPPEEAFRIMSRYEEFGSITDEFKNITKRLDVFGEDITTALKHIISTTPSEPLKEVLGGILTITQTGGNFNEYVSEMADLAMFDYKLLREKYLATLSTYADMYTAILIAAPLFLVSVLVVMNIVPDTSLPGNLDIMTAMSIGVYGLIPVLNILFLGFITITAPEM